MQKGTLLFLPSVVQDVRLPHNGRGRGSLLLSWTVGSHQLKGGEASGLGTYFLAASRELCWGKLSRGLPRCGPQEQFRGGSVRVGLPSLPAAGQAVLSTHKGGDCRVSLSHPPTPSCLGACFLLRKGIPSGPWGWWRGELALKQCLKGHR